MLVKLEQRAEQQAVGEDSTAAAAEVLGRRGMGFADRGCAATLLRHRSTSWMLFHDI